MALDPSIIVLGGIAVGGLTAYCMIQKHKRDTNKRVRPMFVKSDDVLYLPFNRRATVLDVRVKSGQAQYNLDLFGFNEWINEGDLSKWEPKKPQPTASVTGSKAAQARNESPGSWRGSSPVADAARQARQTRERRQEEARRRRDDDDILSNPIHPLNPISPLNTTRHYDDPTPSRSSSYDDCGSSSRSSSYSHSGHSHSCSSSSSSSDSSSSSSDSGSSSSD